MVIVTPCLSTLSHPNFLPHLYYNTSHKKHTSSDNVLLIARKILFEVRAFLFVNEQFYYPHVLMTRCCCRVKALRSQWMKNLKFMMVIYVWFMALHLNNFKVNVYLSLLDFWEKNHIWNRLWGERKITLPTRYDPKPIDCAHIMWFIINMQSIVHIWVFFTIISTYMWV